MNTESNSEHGTQSRRPPAKSRLRNAENRHVIFYITKNGRNIAKRISGLYPLAKILKYNSKLFAEKWHRANNIICIMATGIVVRSIAPLLINKKIDPAVVVLDERGRYVISLLSGHIGGANALAGEIADHLNARAVITTSSDVQGKVALDVWAKEENLHVEDYQKLKHLSSTIVNGHNLKVKTEYTLKTDHIPKEFDIVGPDDFADIIITNRILSEESLFLRPRNLFAGIGCNRNTSKEEIKEVFDSVFSSAKLSAHSVFSLSTIDLKRDEKGLCEFACDAGLEIRYFTKNELNSTASHHKLSESSAVKIATGAVAVAEPAALLAAENHFHNGTIIIPKVRKGNVTLAIAKAEYIL
jgi:cobalamin biosynthesis protein CbiG